MISAEFRPRISDEYRSHAAYYALYLRQAYGYSPARAAELVIERYPRLRAELERFTRRTPADPLAEAKRCAS